MLWSLLTNLGDAGLMVPTAITIAVWLWATGSVRSVVLWLALFGAAALLVAVTKIAFLGWGLGIYRWNFTGISGHAMLSTAVLPVAGFLLGQILASRYRFWGFGGGLAAGALIALSRVALHYHSASEALAGAGLGAAVAVLFIMRGTPTTLRRGPPLLMPLALLAVLCVGYGRPAPSQKLMIETALFLSGRDAPMTRSVWWAQGIAKAKARDALTQASHRRAPRRDDALGFGI